jgi:hypothetical protein
MRGGVGKAWGPYRPCDELEEVLVHAIDDVMDKVLQLHRHARTGGLTSPRRPYNVATFGLKTMKQQRLVSFVRVGTEEAGHGLPQATPDALRV